MRRPLAGLAFVVGLVFVVGVTSSAYASGGPPKPPPKPKPSTSAPTPAPAPGPTPAKPEASDWSRHTGSLKFVVGFDEGMEQAWTAGRPAMLFFTSAKDKWCPIFGARTWTSKAILEKLKAYLPVLVDADEKRGQELMKTYTVMILPAVVWVDADGNQLFEVQGDAPLEIFDSGADVAKERAPDVKPPEELAFAARVRADLKKATEANNLRKMLDAATALATMKRPKAAREEGTKLLAELDAKGRARLDATTKALADGKTADATAELEKLASDYRGRDVGLAAAEALAKAKGSAAGEK